MQFNGFTQETSDVLWDLAFHNERPWFMEHREQFLRVLKEPFDALGRETLELMRQKYPDWPLQLHISRIYRDARRLFGRGPYKDHLWFTIWSGVEKRDSPAFWFEISASGYEYGGGFFDALPEEMEAYRAYIRENPEEVSRLMRRINRLEEFHLVGPDYKRPKGDVGELLNPWYNKKWVGVSAAFDFGGDVLKPELPAILAEKYEELMPLYLFLRQFRREEQENFSDR